MPDGIVEAYGRGDPRVGQQVGGKVDPHLCAVVESYRMVDNHHGAVFEHRENGHARAKQKERNAPFAVELANLCKHRERRVVNHHPVVGIIGIFVVASRKERAQDLFALKWVYAIHIGQYSLVHVLRRVAVVGGLRVVGKLLDKRLVVMVNHAAAKTAAARARRRGVAKKIHLYSFPCHASTLLRAFLGLLMRVTSTTRFALCRVHLYMAPVSIDRRVQVLRTLCSLSIGNVASWPGIISLRVFAIFCITICVVSYLVIYL